MWGILFVLALILGVALMYPVYMKWQYYAPTVTSIDSTNYPIWNIYFPAITVCSNNKIVSKYFRSALNKPPWKNISDESNDTSQFKKDLYEAVKITLLFQVSDFTRLDIHLMDDIFLSRKSLKC